MSDDEEPNWVLACVLHGCKGAGARWRNRRKGSVASLPSTSGACREDCHRGVVPPWLPASHETAAVAESSLESSLATPAKDLFCNRASDSHAGACVLRSERWVPPRKSRRLRLTPRPPWRSPRLTLRASSALSACRCATGHAATETATPAAAPPNKPVTRVATPAPSRTCALTAATAPPPTQTFSGTTKLAGLQLHITTKHDDKKNKATFEECFGADCSAKA